MGRWLLNLAILSGLLLASYFLEVKIELHEALESLLRPRESYQADAIIVPAVLSVFVFLFIQMFQLKREAKRRRAAEQKALALSLHDPLTGLGNRRKLEQIIAGLAPGEARAVFMLDLDDFKPVNDIFGHAAGDAVLLEAAGRIAGICGPGALVCRFGGDEFAVLTGAIAGEDEAGLLAQRMVGAFYKPFMVGTAQSNVGVSIGVTMLHGGEMTGADAIRQADLALYQAKRDDHNDYRIFTQAMDDELRHRKLMERKLRAAIETGAVKTYFQPQVDLKTGEVMGFEALDRCRARQRAAVRIHRAGGRVGAYSATFRASPAQRLPGGRDLASASQVIVQFVAETIAGLAHWPAHPQHPRRDRPFAITPRSGSHRNLACR